MGLTERALSAELGVSLLKIEREQVAGTYRNSQTCHSFVEALEKSRISGLSGQGRVWQGVQVALVSAEGICRSEGALGREVAEDLVP